MVWDNQILGCSLAPGLQYQIVCSPSATWRVNPEKISASKTMLHKAIMIVSLFYERPRLYAFIVFSGVGRRNGVMVRTCSIPIPMDWSQKPKHCGLVCHFQGHVIICSPINRFCGKGSKMSLRVPICSKEHLSCMLSTCILSVTSGPSVEYRPQVDWKVHVYLMSIQRLTGDMSKRPVSGLLVTVVSISHSCVLSTQLQWDCMVDGNANGRLEPLPTLALHVL